MGAYWCTTWAITASYRAIMASGSGLPHQMPHASNRAIVPFLAALVVSVVLCALGFILGIKFCVYLLFSALDIIFDRFRHPPKVASSKPSVTAEQLLALTNPVAAPQLPTSRLESMRSKVAEAGEEPLYRVLLPRKYRKYR
jgi:hypothetical protein